MSLFVFLLAVILFFLSLKYFSNIMYEYTESKFVRLIKSIEKNKYLFLFLGIIMTALLQSSTLCICIIIILINNRILTLDNSIYFIMGSNIGTCVTSYLFVLPSIWFVLIFIIIFLLMLLFRSKYYKIFLILSIIFFSMYLMKSSASFLNNTIFLDLLLKYNNKYFYIFISFITTGIIQSSSLFTSILQSLLFNNLIALDACFYMILGSNIGTSITSIIMSIDMDKEAKRCSYINIIFNTIGTIVLFIIMEFFDISKIFLNMNNSFVLTLANFNLLLNIINVVVVFYFSDNIIKVVKRIVP